VSACTSCITTLKPPYSLPDHFCRDPCPQSKASRLPEGSTNVCALVGWERAPHHIVPRDSLARRTSDLGALAPSIPLPRLRSLARSSTSFVHSHTQKLAARSSPQRAHTPHQLGPPHDSAYDLAVSLRSISLPALSRCSVILYPTHLPRLITPGEPAPRPTGQRPLQLPVALVSLDLGH